MSDVSRQAGEARRPRGSAPASSVAAGHHVDELAAAYVLGALEPAEREQVERHRRLCPACDRLLAEESRIVNLLPFAVPTADVPPPDVKVALFARVAHAHQHAAVAEPSSRAAHQLPPTLTIPASRPIVQPATMPAPVAPAVATAGRRASRFGWLASVATVPLVMALAVVGLWGMQLRERVAERSAEVDALRSTLANFGAGAQTFPLYSTGAEAQGSLTIGADERQGLLRMQINDARRDRAYKLKVLDDDGNLVSAKDVPVNDEGAGQAVFNLEQPFAEYQQVRVEAVPIATGSAAPAQTAEVLWSEFGGSIGSDGDVTDDVVP